MFYKLHPSCQILTNLALCGMIEAPDSGISSIVVRAGFMAPKADQTEPAIQGTSTLYQTQAVLLIATKPCTKNKIRWVHDAKLLCLLSLLSLVYFCLVLPSLV